MVKGKPLAGPKSPKKDKINESTGSKKDRSSEPTGPKNDKTNALIPANGILYVLAHNLDVPELPIEFRKGTRKGPPQIKRGLYRVETDTVHPFNPDSDSYDLDRSFGSLRRWCLYGVDTISKSHFTVKARIFFQDKCLADHETAGPSLEPRALPRRDLTCVHRHRRPVHSNAAGPSRGPSDGLGV